MGRLFGTDGVRGVANKELTPDLVYKIGRASAFYFNKQGDSFNRKKPPFVIVGKDPRPSSDMLEGALIAGICSSGVDVYLTGIIPTPAVSFLTQTFHAKAGIMISASHNPVEDNGIKLFCRNGSKLAPEEEEQIESLIYKGVEILPFPTGKDVGHVVSFTDARDRYIKFLVNTISRKISSLRVVLDCANGATYMVAPLVFKAAGAEVVLINGKGNGERINVECGATNTAKLRKAVLRHKADIGFAFDGDGDRVIAVDHFGREINGDRLMILLGLALKEKKRLTNDIIVTTVMSSCGMEEVLHRYNINVVRTPVGDRYVYEEMIRRNAVIGGEQSGHILLFNYSPTGDGVLTALQVASIVARKGRPLAELALEMRELPQILLNVPASRKEQFATDNDIYKIIKECEMRLLGHGRLLVRPSGTEPIIRVMAEGPDEKEIKEVVETVAKVIEVRLS